MTTAKTTKAPAWARVAEGVFLAAGAYTLAFLIAAFGFGVVLPLNKTVAVVGVAVAFLTARIAGGIRPMWPVAVTVAAVTLAVYLVLVMADGAIRTGVWDLVSGLATSFAHLVSALMGAPGQGA